ncbi:MAG: acyl-CoA dehydrogenase family protein [Actinomycetota bacterium]|nr:acyl-CoA dehydrogenase family protein [Actinomycetota bacterium]
MIGLTSVKEEQEYRILRETAAAYATRELAPQAEELDLESESWRLREVLSKAGKMGLLAALIPEDYGGGGLDTYALCVALEEIGAEEAGVAATLLVHNAAMLPAAIGEFEGLITGVEPDYYPACLAYPGEVSLSGGKLEGVVPFSFNIPDSPLIILLPGGGAGTEAVTVRGDADGVEIEPEPYQMGLRACRAGSLRLRDVEPSNVIEGGGMVEAVERLLFLGLASIATGISRNSLEKAYAYAGERYQAGKIIIEHQAIRLMLAEMVAGIEENRAVISRACYEDSLVPAMSAWLKATRNAHQTVLDGVQIHGGYGYMRDYDMERLMRDAKYCQMYPRTSQEVLLDILELSEKG